MVMMVVMLLLPMVMVMLLLPVVMVMCEDKEALAALVPAREDPRLSEWPAPSHNLTDAGVIIIIIGITIIILIIIINIIIIRLLGESLLCSSPVLLKPALLPLGLHL